MWKFSTDHRWNHFDMEKLHSGGFYPIPHRCLSVTYNPHRCWSCPDSVCSVSTAQLHVPAYLLSRPQKMKSLDWISPSPQSSPSPSPFSAHSHSLQDVLQANSLSPSGSPLPGCLLPISVCFPLGRKRLGEAQALTSPCSTLFPVMSFLSPIPASTIQHKHRQSDTSLNVSKYTSFTLH